MAADRIRDTKRLESDKKGVLFSEKVWNEMKNEEDILHPEDFEKKQVVLLDTNALLMPFQYKINLDISISRIIGGCCIVVPSIIYDEINELSEREDGLFRSALQLAKRYKILEWKIEGMSNTSVSVQKNIVDKEMVNLATYLKKISSRVFVVTNDKEMQKMLLKVKVGVIGLRAGCKLAIIER